MRLSNRHTRLNILTDAGCQSCTHMAEGELESSYHFLIYSPTFARLKLKHLHRHTFEESSKVTGIDIEHLNIFVMSSKLFVDL